MLSVLIFIILSLCRLSTFVGAFVLLSRDFHIFFHHYCVTLTFFFPFNAMTFVVLLKQIDLAFIDEKD